MKHLIEMSEERMTAQQRDAFSSACIGLNGYKITKNIIQPQTLSDPRGRRSFIALDDVAEQVRTFFL